MYLYLRLKAVLMYSGPSDAIEKCSLCSVKEGRPQGRTAGGNLLSPAILCTQTVAKMAEKRKM